MEEKILEEIRRFVATSLGNRHEETGLIYFSEPLVGYASWDDPLFKEYKNSIGEFHLTPREIFAATLDDNRVAAGTVICWVLPISELARQSNRSQEQWPGREWALTRYFGEEFNCELRRHMVEYLTGLGYQAVAPTLSGVFQCFSDTPVGIASNWSERHAAYAAGLGTFSMNDAFISEAGMAMRLGSVITDLNLLPTLRKEQDYRANCLNCNACISRCPVGAITMSGHDKIKCRNYLFCEESVQLAEKYGGQRTSGCGLCQTRVPCEFKNPREKTKQYKSKGTFL